MTQFLCNDRGNGGESQWAFTKNVWYGLMDLLFLSHIYEGGKFCVY
jgi:hypothetical protein